MIQLGPELIEGPLHIDLRQAQKLVSKAGIYYLLGRDTYRGPTLLHLVPGKTDLSRQLVHYFHGKMTFL